MERQLVALVGCPNSGKSALFNGLTGSHQKVGNYPGVTVEKKTGKCHLPSGRTLSIVDLPGIYSFYPHSLDEKITIDFLFYEKAFIICVLDGSSLERTLGIALDLKARGLLSLVLVNMMDLANKRGLVLDLEKLSQTFEVPVRPVSAISYEHILSLKKFLDSCPLSPKKTESKEQKPTPQDLQLRNEKVKSIIHSCVKTAIERDRLSEKIDRVVLHPLWGGPILGVLLFLMFQAIFLWAKAPMEALEYGFETLAQLTEQVLPSGFLSNLLTQGILPGVSAVLVFIPQIVILFTMIFLLEASGYMMRAVFIMDRLMGLIGLQGMSFIPLLSSFACAIPGIMSCRSIRNPYQRYITMLMAPLMTCSARWPVYVLVISAFIPDAFYGPFHLQGIVLFGLLLFGVMMAILLAFFARLWTGQKAKDEKIFDMPSYKMPSFKNLFWFLKHRVMQFVTNGGKMILGISIVLWFLGTYPVQKPSYQSSPIHGTFLGQAGLLIEPIFKPLGFDWRIATALLPGFAAREVMVGALATVFALENEDVETEKGSQKLGQMLQKTWPFATGMSLLVWYVFAPQCLSTFAVLRRESQSKLLTWGLFGFYFIMAYGFSFLTFQLFSMIS